MDPESHEHLDAVTPVNLSQPYQVLLTQQVAARAGPSGCVVQQAAHAGCQVQRPLLAALDTESVPS